MKVRDFRRMLMDLGCVRVRCRGSHEIWQTPSGETLRPVTVKHLNADIPEGTLQALLRRLHQAA